MCQSTPSLQHLNPQLMYHLESNCKYDFAWSIMYSKLVITIFPTLLEGHIKLVALVHLVTVRLYRVKQTTQYLFFVLK